MVYWRCLPTISPAGRREIVPDDLSSDGEPNQRPVMLGDVFGRLGWLPAVRLNALWSAAAGGVLPRMLA
jgi:hypothetical protein